MSETIVTKQCSKCKEIKPLSEFYKDLAKKDARRIICKNCDRKKAVIYAQTKKGKASKRKYYQTEKGKVAHKRYRQSKKGKATKKRYRQTENGKAIIQRYHQSEKGRIVVRNSIQRYKRKYPERVAAHKAVKNAIKEGVLPPINTLKCACNKQAVDYHHHKGYAPEHWLDVIPMCRECHLEQR